MLGAGIENAVLAISLTYAACTHCPETLTIRSSDYWGATVARGRVEDHNKTHLAVHCHRMKYDMAGHPCGGSGSLVPFGFGAQPPSLEWGAMISRGGGLF
jgi:hypothetical protein